ncbi:MAG: primosomal protein N' [Desulfamplus sp.]|nr:primosomal protein N' [Desulfamplus sp.]
MEFTESRADGLTPLAGSFAEVAVAVPVHHTFTYKIPDHLMERVFPGMRVLVPLGRQRVTGYVVAKKHDCGEYQARMILDILDDLPLFPPSMIPFFRWIAGYYIHPMGEVIRAALPFGLNSRDVRMLSPTRAGIEACDRTPLTPPEIKIMMLLKEKGTVAAKTITSARGGIGSHALIKKMESRGLVTISSRLKKDLTRIKTEPFVSLGAMFLDRPLDIQPVNSDIDPPDSMNGINLHDRRPATPDHGNNVFISKVKRTDGPGSVDSLNKQNFSEIIYSPERVDAVKYMDPVKCLEENSTVKLSAKRREILSIIFLRGEMSMSGLKKEIPTAPRLVKLMVEDGYLRTREKQIFRDPLGDTVDPDTPPSLTREQEEVVKKVQDSLDGGFRRYLLSGVTGSGKTEVYMRLVAEAALKGMGAIVLVPEISLISQTERRFRARFGNTIAVLHSGLSQGEILDQWHLIASGRLSIVIGARSAIFAPVNNPGIIIVDEEHDTSYKQESGLRYNARDIAVVRAQQHGISVILGSATPSVHSYFNVCQGKFTELTLKKRVNKHPLPKITLVDLKKYKDHRPREKLITPELSKEIARALSQGDQILIFINRRGFATFPVCEGCGEAVKCRYCDITMTLHKDGNDYRCHLCGFSSPSSMSCPSCKSKNIKPLGFGTEKIETLLKGMFPHARTARLDQDTGSKKGATVQILKKVKNRTVDIIVGTQMLAKGHDFPGITLVGVICADLSLNFPDFRSGERTFQLLAQVAGRAGRGEKPGRVVMQTYNPEHFTIEASRNQDFVQFYQSEIPFRKALSYPPFSRIIQLKISGLDPEKVRDHAVSLGEMFRLLVHQYKQGQAGTGQSHDIEILGPIEAGIPKIAMRYRWQIILKSPLASLLNQMVRQMMEMQNKFSTKDVSVAIDVDPYFMM